MLSAINTSTDLNLSGKTTVRQLNRKRVAKTQLNELQRLLVLDAIDPECTPVERANLARAWDVLENRRRILSEIGTPRPVTAKNEGKHGKPKPKHSIAIAVLDYEPVIDLPRSETGVCQVHVSPDQEPTTTEPAQPTD